MASPARSKMTASDFASDADFAFLSAPTFRRASPTFSSSTPRFKRTVPHGPGPGSYNVGSRRTAGRVFLDTRTKRGAVRPTATDAVYDVPASPPARGTSSAFVSTTPRGLRLGKEGPDPGTYQPDHTASDELMHAKGAGAAAIFRSSSPRTRVSTDPRPAPGSYAVDSSFGSPSRSRGYTSVFHSRVPRLAHKPSNTPAPGAHDVSSSFSAAGGGLPSCPFRSRSPKIAPPNYNNYPAPGQYEVEKSIGKEARNVVFSSVPRDRERLDQSPGPTSYTVAVTRDSTTPYRSLSAPFRSVTRRFRDPTDTVPGPYDVPAGGEPKGGYFLRDQRFKAKYSDTPGPGTYTYREPANRRTKSVVLGSSNRYRGQRSYTPGPGSYQLTRSLSDKGVSAGFRSKSVVQPPSVQNKLGPGEYHSASLATCINPDKGVSFASNTAPRFPSRPNNMPGPGHFIQSYSSFLPSPTT